LLAALENSTTKLPKAVLAEDEQDGCDRRGDFDHANSL
jgi:hypothetical protein